MLLTNQAIDEARHEADKQRTDAVIVHDHVKRGPNGLIDLLRLCGM